MLKRLVEFARENRRNPTWSETVLWSELRGRRSGYRFRRQQPIGPYIVDFVCFEKRLIIELDGLTHDDEGAWERDLARQRWLEGQGFQVLRFNDEDVRENRDDAGRAIWAALRRL